MNTNQTLAVKYLRKALQRCHDAGLTGGVYDSSFWIWPATSEPRNFGNFFENIEAAGGDRIDTRMILDGGAGV